MYKSIWNIFFAFVSGANDRNMLTEVAISEMTPPTASTAECPTIFSHFLMPMMMMIIPDICYGRHTNTLTIQIKKCTTFFLFWSEYSAHFTRLIRKFSTYLTFPLWLHPAFNCTWHFHFEHLWQLCKIPFFCICHNRSEISANIIAICNDIAGWVILQVKHSNANVSVLHHRATVTLIENLENYWNVKVASFLWEISRGQLDRPSLIRNSQIKVHRFS